VLALAKACNVSVRTLERFFLHESPRCWLKRVRLLRAVGLLRDGRNIKETSACLGYEDPSHFSREFKKYYGTTPKKYPNSRVKAPATHDMSHMAMKS